MQGIDGLAEKLPDSQEGLFSKELVDKWFVDITTNFFCNQTISLGHTPSHFLLTSWF